jgi:hypothetical protein
MQVHCGICLLGRTQPNLPSTPSSSGSRARRSARACRRHAGRRFRASKLKYAKMAASKRSKAPSGWPSAACPRRPRSVPLQHMCSSSDSPACLRRRFLPLPVFGRSASRTLQTHRARPENLGYAGLALPAPFACSQCQRCAIAAAARCKPHAQRCIAACPSHPLAFTRVVLRCFCSQAVGRGGRRARRQWSPP